MKESYFREGQHHHQLVSSSSNKPGPLPYVLRAIVMRLHLKGERRTWKQRLHDSTSLITAVSYIGIISQLFITTQPHVHCAAHTAAMAAYGGRGHDVDSS